MLAQRFPGILPAMSQDEALEAAAVQSLSTRGFAAERFGIREWRAPHHTASAVALVGGGSPPRPGEISLAHHGVLFLDELPEFSRHVLEVLREPLESGRITISRAAQQADFPARFQLVAAMNPCPCGYLGHFSGRCACTPEKIARYRGRLSGPLLDRIDLHVEVPALREQRACGSAERRTVGAGARPRGGGARGAARPPGPAQCAARRWRHRAQLHPRARCAGAAARCRIEAFAFGARLPPRAQGGEDDRRSRRRAAPAGRARRGGAALSTPSFAQRLNGAESSAVPAMAVKCCLRRSRDILDDSQALTINICYSTSISTLTIAIVRC